MIVAAEGGASRAAFAAATAVGEFIDQANELPDAKDRAIAPARRIFAISGVSGGSFGAATIRTALADSLERGQSAPPCQRVPPGWFGAATGEVTTSWRACLQALVSGDYLSPAFVGLAFRDNFSPPNPVSGGSLLFSDDRAALVERAWERHYDEVVRGEIPTFWEHLYQDLGSSVGPDAGLRSRFGFLSDKLAKLDGAWLPLLLLNGTSVATGTRIIASDLISTRAAPGGDGHPPGRFSIYPAAFDVFEMLSKPCPKGEVAGQSCKTTHDGMTDLPNVRAGADIRLSTAAVLSARFPIISPAGNLRAEGDGKIGDRIVDGGYFENAGLTTAMDVARELRRLGVVSALGAERAADRRGRSRFARHAAALGCGRLPGSAARGRHAGTEQRGSCGTGADFRRRPHARRRPVGDPRRPRRRGGGRRAARALAVESGRRAGGPEADRVELLHVRHVPEPEIQAGRR